MANDRVWIRCATCGERLLWFKFYPVGGAVDGPYVFHDQQKQEAWVTEHLHDRASDPHLAGDPGFALETESDA